MLFESHDTMYNALACIIGPLSFEQLPHTTVLSRCPYSVLSIALTGHLVNNDKFK